MKRLISLEELFLFFLSVFLFVQLPFAWWWFLVLFLAPDVSMLGYAAGPRVGSIAYNFAHHRAVAVAAFLLGALLGSEALQLAGVVMLGHSSFDRILGYGLKYPDSFQHTHLGWMGDASGR